MSSLISLAGMLLKVLATTLLAVAVAVGATLRTEVITLQYRDAGSVASTLRALVPEGGFMTASGYTLVVRADAATLAEIRVLLSELDRPRATLLVSVRQGRERARSAAGLRTWSRVPGGTRAESEHGFGGGVQTLRSREHRGEVRVYSSRGLNTSDQHSSVQVLDGASAFISTGRLVPLEERSVVSDGDIRSSARSIRYQPVETGFYVQPRLVENDTAVVMTIAPERAALDTGPRSSEPPSIHRQSVQTTVRGRLGEWIPLAATQRATSNSDGARLRSTESFREANSQVFVKVEIVQ